MTAAENAPDPSPEVVSTDGEVVGRMKGVLWKDRTGFDVVTISTAGRELVVPVRHQLLDPASPRVQVEFSSETVRTAPSPAELITRGSAGAVRHIADRYHVRLAGPLPGTDPVEIPPWLRIPPAGSGGPSQQPEGAEPDSDAEAGGANVG